LRVILGTWAGDQQDPKEDTRQLLPSCQTNFVNMENSLSLISSW
jgi:hypothetical protein